MIIEAATPASHHPGLSTKTQVNDRLRDYAMALVLGLPWMA